MISRCCSSRHAIFYFLSFFIFLFHFFLFFLSFSFFPFLANPRYTLNFLILFTGLTYTFLNRSKELAIFYSEVLVRFIFAFFPSSTPAVPKNRPQWWKSHAPQVRVTKTLGSGSPSFKATPKLKRPMQCAVRHPTDALESH